MQADYQRIVGILEDQLLEAVKGEELAAARFGRIRKDIPGGPSYPDAAQRIANASKNYIQALKEVARAIQRIADYQIHAIVPDEIKRLLGTVFVLGGLTLTQEQLGRWCFMLVGIPVGC